MTLAQRVAAHYRRLAGHRDTEWHESKQLDAIADVVEAGERMAEIAYGEAEAFDTALANLAKAVGVEGE